MRYNQAAATVKQLLFMETGQYDDAYARPYETNADDVGIITQLRDDTYRGSNINETSVSGIASQLIAPSAVAGRGIEIAHGWDERRYRFMMEIEVNVTGTPVRKILQGYTDHVGVAGDFLDPDMRMYVNNIIVMREMGRDSWQMYESSQIIVDDLKVHGNGKTREALMRPMDLFNNLWAENNYAPVDDNHDNGRRGYEFNPDKGWGDDDTNGWGRSPRDVQNLEVVDLRSSTTTQALKSTRHNNNHNRYLAKSLSALHTSLEQADIAGEQAGTLESIYNEAEAKVREKKLLDDSVLDMFDNAGGYGEYGFITYGMLCSLCPSTEHVVEHFEMAPALKQGTNHRGRGSSFNGSTDLDIIMSIIKNIVPGMMMDCLLTKICFSATNLTQTGEYEAWVDAGREDNTDTGWGNRNSQRNLPRGFVHKEGDNGLGRYIDQFINRIVSSLLPDITMRNQLRLNISVEADIMGEMYIFVEKVDGIESDSGEWTVPCFSDGLFSPVIATTTNELSDVANDINTLASNIGAVLETDTSVAPRRSNGW